VTTSASPVPRDRLNLIVGLLTSLFALALYLKTLAPTISFWDCGEFVAASICFGIPHPPGSAIFILFGRIFSVIPFAEDLAYRVNLISALSSAGSVFIAYFIITKVVSLWHKKQPDFWGRLGMYLGGVVGSLCMGFNRTFWTNAVEAEVYGLTMLVFFAIMYLLIDWYTKYETEYGDRQLILIFYLAMIGVGIHMSAFIVMPAGFIFMAIVDKRLRVDYRYWITVVVVSIIMMKFYWFLIGVGAWLIICIFAASRSKLNRMWKLSGTLAFVALLGFSVQFYIPLLSQHNPDLDMNNPDSIPRLKLFVEREQYGQKNMFVRMLTRRGDLSNQFGDFPRMGFWRFFSEQYSKPGIVFFVLFVLGLFGIYRALARRTSVGILILLLALAGTIGLTLYMNFADGTQIEPGSMLKRLEVRDRDYFWTPGFAVFGMCLGLGIAGLYRSVRKFVSGGNLGSPLVKIVSAAMCLTLFLPAATIAHNYWACNRTYDTLPYDYAYNVLNSCEENSVLFTAGDNDTFPLWALQFGLGIRRDVHIVNLSLLDVDWYILQTKTDLESLGGLVSLDSNQIITYPTPIRTSEGVIEIALPKVEYYDAFRRENRILGLFQDANGDLVRTNHQVIENILLNNIDSSGNWKHPIYFANLPPAEVAYDLRKYAEKVGMVYEIKREPRNRVYNLDKSYRIMTEVMQLRNVDNPRYYKDETATSFTLAAGQKYIDLYNALLAAGDSTRALDIYQIVSDKIPEFWEQALIHSQVDSIFGLEGKTDVEYKEEYLAYVDELLKYAPDNYYYMQYKGMILQALDRYDDAIEALMEAFESMPTSSVVYRSLAPALLSQGRYEEAIRLTREFAYLNPLDESARRFLEAYQRQMQP